jgi:hypothetical protein
MAAALQPDGRDRASHLWILAPKPVSADSFSYKLVHTRHTRPWPPRGSGWRLDRAGQGTKVQGADPGRCRTILRPCRHLAVRALWWPPRARF